MYTIGIDVGGTSIKAGLVLNEKIIYKTNVKSDKIGGCDKISKDIVSLVEDILKSQNIKIEEIASIGIGIPGIVNKKKGITCINLNLKNDDLIGEIHKTYKNTPVFVENDATVAAIAEYEYGCMKNSSIGVMLTLGTGVGGGIIIDGKPISGVNGIGSELGHLIIGENFYDCNCGNNGCVESFCSATAIIKYAKKIIQEGSKSLITKLCDDNLEEITAKIVFDAYEKNDEVAVKTIKRFKEYLIRAIVSIVHFIDPDIICIGGGVSLAKDVILENLKEEVEKRVIYSGNGVCDIKIATLKNDAGIIGASALK